MKKNILLLILSSLLLLATVGYGKTINLYSLFPNLTLGSDPGGMDTVYVTCGGLTVSQVTVQIWVKTDNTGVDALQGIYVPVEVTADQPGVTLDTTLASTYTGTAVQSWDDSVLYVSVVSNGGDPSAFPMQLILGGVDLDQSGVLGAGNHLLANLKFNVSQPTNICIEDTFSWYLGSLTLVTTEANGYTPAFKGDCCGPIVPTLTEWGLIIFGVLLLGGLIWYLRRRRVTRLA